MRFLIELDALNLSTMFWLAQVFYCYKKFGLGGKSQFPECGGGA